MGQPMAQRLLDAQLSVVAYNRTQSKLEPLRQSGAKIAETPQDAIAPSGKKVEIDSWHELIRENRAINYD
jgi:6-phosphogluconate dehydrogenase (decarboxylating)